MSLFDLFRGFFGVPGGRYPGQRDPFFDAMTHDEDDEDDDEEEDGYFYGAGDRQDPFDSAWRFGFSFGPDGMRMQEPQAFGHVLREMEEIFSQLGGWEGRSEPGHFGVPTLPPPQDRVDRIPGGSSGNPLRDFMLKFPGEQQRQQVGPPSAPRSDSEELPNFPGSPSHGWTPFSKFNDVWRRGPQSSGEERKEDGDLDSAVSSGGLDQILTPPAGQIPNQPGTRSFFQSVTVTKVVKPDGTVEEKRTVRDSQGKEETTITRSGGPRSLEGPEHQAGPLVPGGQRPFSDMRDDNSLFSKFFGGFK